jgi:hypothetical protein
MEKQSKSLGGMVSNLRDAWDIFLRNEGQKLIEWGKQLVGWAIHVVDDVFPAMIIKINELITWFNENRMAIVLVAGALVGALIPAIYAMIAAFVAGAIALAPFMIGGAVIAGLVYGITSIAKNWEQTKDSIGFIWETIKEIWGAGTDWVKGKIDDLIGWFDNLINKIKDAIEWLKKYSGFNAVSGAFNSASNFITGARAGGGPVSSGRTYLVGENGPELFTPSAGGSIISNSGSGGGLNITITGNTFLDEYAAEKVGDMIVKKLGMSNKFA